jgi:hypothetical protein
MRPRLARCEWKKRLCPSTKAGGVKFHSAERLSRHSAVRPAQGATVLEPTVFDDFDHRFQKIKAFVLISNVVKQDTKK